MSDRFVVESVDGKNSDLVLVALVVLLVGMGFVVMFSSSYFYAERLVGDAYFFLKKHVQHILLGAIAAFLAARLRLDAVRRATPLVLIGSLVLVLLTFVPGIGREINGARRWIDLGVMFQPSELAKPAIVLYLAHIFTKKSDRLDDLFNTLLPPLLVVSAFVALIYLQNDFSTAIFVLFVAFCMFFMAGVRVLYFVFLASAAVPLSIILLLTKEHRVQRIITFLDPQVDPVGVGYQVIAARSAVIQGGFWGSGLGKGVKKLGGLPYAHSDFVFAVLAEEAGFVGVLFVLTLFIALAARGFMICSACKDRYAYLLSFGVTLSLVSQALFNIAVVSGLVPATGIPLPFFSTGGSSLLVTLIMCGLLINVSRTVRTDRRGIDE